MFVCKQKTAYEMRISDWSSDVCSSDLDRALQLPGVSNAWTMPIKMRTDMQSTGIRTPLGLKIFGTDLVTMDRLAKQIEVILRTVPGTSSAFAERVIGGYYLTVEPDRTALSRYGTTIGEFQDVIAMALGGETVTTTVEGRERYSVNLRYPRALRSDPQSIAGQVLVPTANGGMVPLGQVASIQLSQGPGRLRTENAQLAE